MSRNRTRLSLALVMCALASHVAPGRARAEENRYNAHLELGPLFTLQQPGGLQPSGRILLTDVQVATAGLHVRVGIELSLSERFGLEAAWSPSTVFSLIGGSRSTLQQHLTLGVRIRPWFQKAGGYLYPISPGHQLVWREFLSDVWLDANGGVVLANATSVGYDVGVGARLPLVSPLQVGLYARFSHFFAVDGSDDSPSFMQIAVGVSLSLGVASVHSAPDADRDGVPDAEDRCPNTPKGETVNQLGCPVPQGTSPPPRCSDTDLDGVCDGQDDCPETPLGTKVDKKGCPLEAPPTDAEGATPPR